MRGKSNVITKLRKRNVEKVWGVCYTLGARYLSKVRYISSVVLCIQCAQDMDWWLAHLNVVMNLQVPKMWGISPLAVECINF